MVPGDDKDRNACFGHLKQGLHCHLNQRLRDPAPVEKITSVDHQIHISPKGRLERPFKVGEEIVAPPSPHNARPKRQVKAQMGISDK
jgi:hypothetical protein